MSTFWALMLNTYSPSLLWKLHSSRKFSLWEWRALVRLTMRLRISTATSFKTSLGRISSWWFFLRQVHSLDWKTKPWSRVCTNVILRYNSAGARGLVCYGCDPHETDVYTSTETAGRWIAPERNIEEGREEPNTSDLKRDRDLITISSVIRSYLPHPEVAPSAGPKHEALSSRQELGCSPDDKAALKVWGASRSHCIRSPFSSASEDRRLVGCRYKANCPHVRPEPLGECLRGDLSKGS